MSHLTKAKLFKKYNYPSWSFKTDSSAINPPVYNNSNWSNDNIKIKKDNQATNFDKHLKRVLKLVWRVLDISYTDIKEKMVLKKQ